MAKIGQDCLKLHKIAQDCQTLPEIAKQYMMLARYSQRQPKIKGDRTFLNIRHKEKISFSPPFSSKMADLTENVRLEGPEKQAIVSCGGPEKQAISLL